MAEIINSIEFGEKVDDALESDKRTRRWLMAELKDYGITLTDTQLSNRCAGYVPFQEDEMDAIKKVFKKNKIEF